MKITHHLGRFATFFKESSLVIRLVIVASGIGIIAGTATVAAMVATPNNTETSTNSTTSDSNSVVSDTDNQPSTKSDSEQVDTMPEDQTVNESNVSTSTQPTSQTATTQPTQTATNTNPQQTPTPTPTAPTCNESMKSSYTSLYNSQVNAENASWTNQITAWNNYASANGMAFSGYVQSMINDNKPAHDARLAQLQTQHYQNLASINCQP